MILKPYRSIAVVALAGYLAACLPATSNESDHEIQTEQRVAVALPIAVGDMSQSFSFPLLARKLGLKDQIRTLTLLKEGEKGKWEISTTSATYYPSQNQFGRDTGRFMLTTRSGQLLQLTIAVDGINTLEENHPFADHFEFPVTVGNYSRSVNWQSASRVQNFHSETLDAFVTQQGMKGEFVVDGALLIYHPYPNQSGSDLAHLQIKDSYGHQRMISVQVNEIDTTHKPCGRNTSPFAKNFQLNLAQSKVPSSIQVNWLLQSQATDPDNDGLSAVVIQQGKQGRFSTLGQQLTYKPNQKMPIDQDQGMFVITDGKGGLVTVKVTINGNEISTTKS